jgi:glycosyltransferase involved in cell wall biosynthesis
MRILQISSARHFGGGERHVVDLSNGLAEAGHDVFVAAIPDSPILAELRPGIQQRFFELSPLNPLNFTKAVALRRFVRKHAIEIVHAHMARDYPLAALAVGGDRRPELIITRHVLFPMSKLHRVTRRRVARVIAVSQAVASAIHDQGIFRNGQVNVVRNGIDLAKFHLRSLKHSPDGMRVGILGELTANKGQLEFLRAAELVAAEIENVDFIIAGRDHSDGEYGRQVKKLIAESKSRDRIQLIESPIDVAQFLSDLDVLVSASRSEAFGLTIIEAMAASVPVVASATAGASEIITDNRTGLLVPINDVNAMAAAISLLLKNPEKRRQIGESARHAAIESFSLKRMVSDTVAVYRDVLDNRQSVSDSPARELVG